MNPGRRLQGKGMAGQHIDPYLTALCVKAVAFL